MTDVSAFVITQISRNRTITLYDRALPYRPYTLKGTQRVEMTWLPGYAEATATVLGPAVEPTQVTGMWKAKYIEDTRLPPMVEDNGIAVRSVDSVIDIFNTLRREGLLLLVTWGNTTRKGFIRSLETQHFTLEDVQWTLEFVWINEGEDTVPVVLPQTSSTQGAANQFSQQLNQITNTATKPPYGSPWNQRATVLSILSSLKTAVTSAQDILSLQFGVAIRPLDATRRMLAVSNTVVNQNDTLIARYGNEVPGASSVIPLPLQTAAQRLAAQVNSREVISRTRVMRRTAIEQGLDLTTQTTAQIQAVYKAREGDDLRRLAKTYYGNERDWRRILTFNLLSSSLLSAGQLVLIPKISELNADQV